MSDAARQTKDGNKGEASDVFKVLDPIHLGVKKRYDLN
jgi:hypothetical protein